MTSRRGTTNTAIRGNAAARRVSKRALLVRDGDGEKAPCWECGTVVTFETMVRDKIIPGVKGGRYVLKNLRVHCSPCSIRQGQRMGTETRRWKCWAKRGLRTSQVSPSGERTYLAGHWYVYLDGESIGWVGRTSSGTRWCGYRYRATEADASGELDWDGEPLRDLGDRASDLAAAGQKTKRAALYALLVECTTTPRRKAA